MIEFREQYARRELGLEVIAHFNEEGVKAGINPFDHGSKIYTDVMRTQPLKEALTKHSFDGAIGGGAIINNGDILVDTSAGSGNKDKKYDQDAAK